MAETGIPYCDRTWDLTIGCRKRSEGCDNCWATRIVHRLARKGLDGYCTHADRDRTDREPRFGEIQTTPDGKDWEPTDVVNLLHWNLDKPCGWRKPQFIFVNSKSDLFDERVPFEFIGKVFDRMWSPMRHSYMILTKEPARMAEFISWYQTTPGTVTGRSIRWPDDFANVILMTTVESPAHIDRIDTLMRIPAAMRGVSIEPMLDPIASTLPRFLASTPRLDWVVIGCEKLLGGRAGRWAGQEPDAWWGAAAMIVKACQDAGVPVWMKQGPDPYHWNTGVRPPVAHIPANFPPSCRIQQKPKGLIV